MSIYYFSSCKTTVQFKEASIKATEYVKERLGIDPIGCCRINHKKLTKEDTALVVCNNCAAIIEENSDADIIFLWELIDQDENFVFPDYQGKEMTIQDCWIAFEKRHVQDTIRSLLRKMNITVVELKENYENTRYCGVNLLSPCTQSNAQLAHKRYVEDFPHMFTPMSEEEQIQHFQQHCQQITTNEVVCYCKFCTDGINMGGKKGIHLLELIFLNK